VVLRAAKQISLYLLAERRAPIRPLGRQQHAGLLGKLLLERPAAVGQVPEESPGDAALVEETRSRQEFPDEEHIRGVGRRQLIGEWHSVGGTEEVQSFTPYTAKEEPHLAHAAPSNPTADWLTCLGCRTGVQDWEQRGVDDQRLRLAEEFTQDGPPQGLEETPQPPHASAAKLRGGVKDDYAGKKVCEVPLDGVAQERALGLDTSQLLKKRQGQDLGVREALQGFVATRSMRVEEGVGVVGEAEEHSHSVFRLGEAWGKEGLGHLSLLVVGSLMAPVLPPIHATDI